MGICQNIYIYIYRFTVQNKGCNWKLNLGMYGINGIGTNRIKWNGIVIIFGIKEMIYVFVFLNYIQIILFHPFFSFLFFLS